MSTSKRIDLICIAAALVAVALCVVAVNARALGVTDTATAASAYAQLLFDDSSVHTVDLQVDDWDSFIATCTDEEYVDATVTIDGEAFGNVGLRAKGNTSLSNVSQLGSDRYSFKIEFDHYNDAETYHGLDKLCLNNIIQDDTYMKDYVVYKMMADFGVDAPLCSYAYITVNGEDWGLYLAVEGLEDGFLDRVYTGEDGDLYKPDSQSNGAGRGQGKDFNMDDWSANGEKDAADGTVAVSEKDASDGASTTGDAAAGQPGRPGDGMSLQAPEDAVPTDGAMPTPPDGAAAQAPSAAQGADAQGSGAETADGAASSATDNAAAQAPGSAGDGGSGGMAALGNVGNGGAPGGGDMGNGGAPGGGMGTDDVKLQYIDDDPDSYSNIFNNAKTTVTDADQERLIASLKSLASAEDLDAVLDTDEVLRYFVVNNFVVNDDSYTGQMIHNYYLYENDGQLSMIPWDYNLAFGGFGGGDATSAVNDPIDEVLDDRPMQAWIFSSEQWTDAYHELYREFLKTDQLQSLIERTQALIAPYVERDPTKFCTYDEWEAGVAALKEFCELRTQSVEGQLDGTIPDTSAGQQEDSSALVQAGDLQLSAMGSMGGGGGMGGAGDKGAGNMGAGGGIGAPGAGGWEGTDAGGGDGRPAGGAGRTMGPGQDPGSADAASGQAQMPQLPDGAQTPQAPSGSGTAP